MGPNKIPKIDLILALSKSLDLVSPILSSHHMRVAYISMNIGLRLNLTRLDIKDLIIAALLHDVGAVSFKDRMDSLEFDMKKPERHARVGYHLIKKYKKFSIVANIIKYHHTKWDSRELYKDSNIEIPISSDIIHLSDRVDILIGQDRDADIDIVVRKILLDKGKKFNPKVIDAFLEIANNPKDTFNPDSNTISIVFNSFLGDIFLSMDESIEMTKIFENIIDFRSRFTATHSRGVSNTAMILSGILGMNSSDMKKIKIAGQLHDIGKLGVQGYILEKPGKLTPEEIIEVKNHALYTYHVLSDVRGFEDIPQWAALHHEKIGGGGYPFNKKGDELDLGSRIMAVADIFTAIMEDRPYRKGMDKDKALKIFNELVKKKDVDGDVVAALISNYDKIDYIRKETQQEAAMDFQNFWKDAYDTKL